MRERIVFAVDAFGEPSFGNAESLRKEPGLGIPLVITEIGGQGEFCQEEGNLIQPPPLQVFECGDAALTYNGSILNSGRD